MENELTEANEEMKGLTVESRRTEVEGSRVLTTAGASVGREAVSRTQHP